MKTRDTGRAIKTTRKKESLSENRTRPRRPDVYFWQGRSLEDLAREQGIIPIKDERDLERIFGKYPEWDDIDEFLTQAHK